MRAEFTRLLSVAADHTVPCPNEKFQYVEDLRLDRDEAITAAQLATVGIKDEFFKPIEQNRGPAGWCHAAFPTWHNPSTAKIMAVWGINPRFLKAECPSWGHSRRDPEPNGLTKGYDQNVR